MFIYCDRMRFGVGPCPISKYDGPSRHGPWETGTWQKLAQRAEFAALYSSRRTPHRHPPTPSFLSLYTLSSNFWHSAASVCCKWFAEALSACYTLRPMTPLEQMTALPKLKSPHARPDNYLSIVPDKAFTSLPIVSASLSWTESSLILTAVTRRKDRGAYERLPLDSEGSHTLATLT